MPSSCPTFAKMIETSTHRHQEMIVKKTTPVWMALIIGFLSPVTLTQAQASDDEHFEGEQPETYVQAQAVLQKYNAQLAAFAEDGEISPAEMGQVHELTYTLENALEKMEDTLDQVAERLEVVHEGSEHGAYQSVLDNTRQYLQASTPLLAPGQAPEQ